MSYLLCAVTLLDTTLKESLEWVTYARQHDDPQKRGVSDDPLLIMAAVYAIGQAIIFLPCAFYLSSSFFFPRLISAVTDWMSTILPHMVWP